MPCKKSQMRPIYILFIIFCCFSCKEQKSDTIRIGVLNGPTAISFIQLIDKPLMIDGKRTEIIFKSDPQQIQALMMRNELDFAVLPTVMAANLYNKDVDLQLINVATWGILGLLSREKDLKTVEDFKNKEIIVPFRADMPDIVLQSLIKKAGLDPKKDFKIKYVATPIDAMQMLILRRADNVLLAEPATSIALRKTGSFPVKLIAPDIYRSVNLQDEWGKKFMVKSEIPQAGVAVVGGNKEKKELIEKFLVEYEKAINWYKNNKEEASKLVVKTLPMLEAEGLADSIEHVILKNITAQNSKKDLEFFFNVLLENDKKLIGGKLPADGFYYK